MLESRLEPPKNGSSIETPSEPITKNSVAITAYNLTRQSIACNTIQAALIVVSDTFILFKKTNILCLNVINCLVEWLNVCPSSLHAGIERSSRFPPPCK